MLTKLTSNESAILEDAEMKEIAGEGITSCLVHMFECARECEGNPNLAQTLYDDTRAGKGGWM